MSESEFDKGEIVSASRTIAGGTLMVAAVATDTVLYLDDVSAFNETGGTVTIDDVQLDYVSSDPDENTVTLAAGLAGPVAEFTFVAVYPEAPVHTAFVLLSADETGQTIPARIPQAMRALIPEGPREPGMGEAVTVLSDGDEWTVHDIQFRHGEHNANTTPIVVTTDDGESVRIDGEGITTYTNDSVPIRTIRGYSSALATDGTYIYSVSTGSDIAKYDASTGASVAGGFPIAGTFGELATDGTYIYATDAANDIAKYNASTGASVGGGFPIAGTFTLGLAADGTYLYAVDASQDIAKYNASTGASVGGGFPIAGTFLRIATDGTYIYAMSNLSDIYKYNAATGASVGGGFPITTLSTGGHIATDGTYIYAEGDGNDIHKFDAATGDEITSGGFPIVGSFTSIAADGVRLAAVSNLADIRVFNIAEDYPSVLMDSSTGNATLHAVTASDITAEGDASFAGNFTLDSYLITGAWTAYTPTWTASVTNPVIGNGTLTGRYCRIGNTVHFSIEVVAGSTTTFGSGAYSFALPFAMAATQRLTFSGSFLDASASTVYPIWGMRATSTTIQGILDGTVAGSNARSFTNAIPVTVAQNDAFAISGTYEAA